MEGMLQGCPCAREGCAWGFLPWCRGHAFGNPPLSSWGLGGKLGQGKNGDPAAGGDGTLLQGVTCPCPAQRSVGENRQCLECQSLAGGMCRALAEMEPTVDLRAMPIPVGFPVVLRVC